MRLTLLALLTLVAGTAAAAGTPYDFELVRLAPDVFVAMRPDSVRQPGECNSLFIVNERDVVVVDSGGTTTSGENLVKLLRTVTDKPVRYVINTHWHGDHNFGNGAFLRAYPGAEIVGHPTHGPLITGALRKLMSEQIASLPAAQERYRKVAESGISSRTGKPLAPESLRRVRELVEWMPYALAEAPRSEYTPATLEVADELVLRRGAREIRVRWLGLGNTDGDLVVWLPKERIVASGDLVVHPVPYGFGSFPREWPTTLERLKALDWATLVPGHGTLLKDRAYLTRLQQLIRSIDEQVQAAARAGKDQDAAAQSVAIAPELRKSFTGGDAWLELQFDGVFIAPLAKSAWRQAKGLAVEQDGT